jgi:hypothetical protein
VSEKQDLTLKPILEISWDGPFSWPTFENENKLPSIPPIAGVYLQTFEYQGGYLVYAAGLTRRSVPERFRQHKRKYMNGEYNVLDVIAAQGGIRKEIWHGWGYAREHREEFEERKAMILDAVQKQLVGFRIFVTPMREPRVLERLEASIMGNLYRQLPPICDIPDKNMYLAPWRSTEESIIVKNTCRVVLHGLPALLEI